MQIDMLSSSATFFHRSLGASFHHGVGISAAFRRRKVLISFADRHGGGHGILRPWAFKPCLKVFCSVSEINGVGEEGECSSVKKRVGEVRRRRGSSQFLRELEEVSVDLLTIPGVGPRNMHKLMKKGIGKVSELKQIYRDKASHWEKRFL